MKNIKSLLFAVIIALTAFSAASCTDGQDWDVTNGPGGQYNRLFTPQSVSVSTSKNVTTVTWTTYDPGDYYVIEVTNYGRAIDDTVEEGSLAEKNYDKVFGRDGSITDKTFTLPEQLAPGMYQLRIKACSNQGKGESHWLYFTKDNDVYFEIGGGEEEEE